MYDSESYAKHKCVINLTEYKWYTNIYVIDESKVNIKNGQSC